MKLNDLYRVLSEDTKISAEVRQERNTTKIGYEVLSCGRSSKLVGRKEVCQIYPVVFEGEKHPSLVIWVKDADDSGKSRRRK